MSDLDRAVALLTAWHRERPWGRADPRALSIASVERAGALQLALSSVFESRGVRYELEPARERTPHGVAGPDPWMTHLQQPGDAAVGNELSQALLGERVPIDCGGCGASGDVRCRPCDGMGRVESGRTYRTCAYCEGRCVVRCEVCRGSGGLSGAPTVWSRIDVHEELRTTGTDSLPLEVALDLAESPIPGEVLHRQEADALTEVRGFVGYRDSASLPAETADAARALLASPGVPEGTRLRRQTLEVRRAPVFEVRLGSGAVVHVWGAPTRVFPLAPVSTLLGRVLPFLAR